MTGADAIWLILFLASGLAVQAGGWLSQRRATPGYLYAASLIGWSVAGVALAPEWFSWGHARASAIAVGTLAVSGALVLYEAVVASRGPARPADARWSRWPPAALAGMLIVGVPWFEELFFRGAAYAAFLPLGIPVAIAGSAALFALAHPDPRRMPAFFAVGVVLGMLRATSGGLLEPAVVHMLANAIAWVGYAAERAFGPRAPADKDPRPGGS
ncbi:MAG TPA: type II CAAX endopeptidase family protein [Limnochordia bacterium]